MQGYLAMLFTSISLGTIGLFIKLIDGNMHYMSVNFLRIFVGFLFLLIFVPFVDKNTFKVKKSDLSEFALVGLIFAISISLYTTSIFFTSIQSAVMINYSYPIYMLFFGYLILGEKVTRTKLVTLFLAFVGLFIINPMSGVGGSLFGNILALISALSYALLIVMMRREDKTHSIGSVVWFLGFASLFCLPFALYFGFSGLDRVIYYILGLGIISTGFAYFFYNLALEKIEAEIGAVISMIIGPLVSIAFAVLIINEELSFRTIFGGSFLICAGVYLNLAPKIKFLMNKDVNVITFEDE